MRVYLDHAATTALDPEALKTMTPYLKEKYGNPSSIHSYGQETRAAVDAARNQAAALINAKREEIIFTSGGTETNNLALRGIVLGAHSKNPHIIISEIEHHSVLDTALDLKANHGVEISFLKTKKNGQVDASKLSGLIEKETVLVSVMHANNETGVIQPLEKISGIIGEKSSKFKKKIYFHTDAVQTAGKMPLDVAALGVDALSISAHKFYGPKGSGLLYLKKGTPFSTFMTGGGQERNLRSGTENVAGIVGFAEAMRANEKLRKKNEKLLNELSKKLSTEVKKIYQRAVELGKDAERVPGVVSFIFPSIDSETLLIALDMEGIAASSGSACTIGSIEPSHVVLAMGYPKNLSKCLIRFSLGKENTAEEIDYTLIKLKEILSRLGYNKNA